MGVPARWGGAVNLSRAAVLPLALLVSACGGGDGGVSSTPTPPSAPGGPANPGSPSTPQDPPSSANASLLALTASETFTNDAATASVQYPTPTNEGTGKASKATIKIVYDAPSKSYRIEAGGNTQTFLPSDKDITQSNGATTVYNRSTGGSTDTLVLTNPGTSGHLTYQYVGSGIWQHVTPNGRASSADLAAFTYGVETPDGALPRTGTAAYAIDLRGVASGPVASTLDGTGTLQANFASGEVTTNGSLNQHYLDNTNYVAFGKFSGTAQISSASNSFDGVLRLGFFNADGTMSGRFYGPNADEVGATFQLMDGSSAVAIGTITGRQDPTVPLVNTRLTDLRYDQSFDIAEVRRSLTYSSSGVVSGMGGPFEENAALAYSASDGSYSVATGVGVFAFNPSDIDPSRSDNRQTVYENSSGPFSYNLTLYKDGPSNDQIALTYASFGHLQILDGTTSPISTTKIDTYFAYGLKTTQAPVSGTGHYDGLIFGQADAISRTNTLTNYNLSETASLDVNFPSTLVTGTIAPVGTDLNTGTTRSFGTYSVVGPGDLVPGTSGTGTVLGSLSGALYGPNAEEFAGIFHIISPNDQGTTDFVQMQGAVLAKKH